MVAAQEVQHHRWTDQDDERYGDDDQGLRDVEDRLAISPELVSLDAQHFTDEASVGEDEYGQRDERTDRSPADQVESHQGLSESVDLRQRVDARRVLVALLPADRETDEEWHIDGYRDNEDDQPRADHQPSVDVAARAERMTDHQIALQREQGDAPRADEQEDVDQSAAVHAVGEADDGHVTANDAAGSQIAGSDAEQQPGKDADDAEHQIGGSQCQEA
ncbi:hypothetical protein LSH36_343g01019 [Paralvinella palmiformis]|uniref:Uncharacterized protein n=1 Tax=Paralvinella palmiformis TaxID=53620 RepID=A0AAD9JG13_9ANNE|nr:hypothetical protein LSH36_343g01019 [Paralvinella palmiformis]